MVFIGGAVPPPLLEITVTDRAFVPKLAKLKYAGQSIRFKASGTLNHLITVGDASSPLLRPGSSWILDTSKDPSFASGSVEVVCEVNMMKMSVEILEAAEQENLEPHGAVESKGLGGDSHGDDQQGESDGEADEDPTPGVDDEMLDALRRKLAINPKVLRGSSAVAWGGDDDDDDDDAAAFANERQRHGAIARGKA